MNGTIFGIGPLEVLVIGILILLVFGPERLPELTRGLGTALRRLRETYTGFTQEFKGELEPIAQDINEVTREIRQEVDAIRQAADIRSILQPYTDDMNKAVKLDATAKPLNPPASGSTASTPATTATVGNTIAPPKTAAASANTRANGNGAYTRPKSASAVVTPAILQLPEDNPWASIGASGPAVRSDKLDDDSPWRS